MNEECQQILRQLMADAIDASELLSQAAENPAFEPEDRQTLDATARALSKSILAASAWLKAQTPRTPELDAGERVLVDFNGDLTPCVLLYYTDDGQAVVKDALIGETYTVDATQIKQEPTLGAEHTCPYCGGELENLTFEHFSHCPKCLVAVRLATKIEVTDNSVLEPLKKVVDPQGDVAMRVDVTENPDVLVVAGWDTEQDLTLSHVSALYPDYMTPETLRDMVRSNSNPYPHAHHDKNGRWVIPRKDLPFPQKGDVEITVPESLARTALGDDRLSEILKDEPSDLLVESMGSQHINQLKVKRALLQLIQSQLDSINVKADVRIGNDDSVTFRQITFPLDMPEVERIVKETLGLQ